MGLTKSDLMGLPADWLERYEKRIRKGKTPVDCWEWIGAKTRNGYGNFTISSGGNMLLRQLAHRVAYVLAHGEIPENLIVDHICKCRRCVNPEHLEAVTISENSRRAVTGTIRPKLEICRRGHSLTLDNVYTTKSGTRYCRKCNRLRKIRFRQRGGVSRGNRVTTGKSSDSTTILQINGQTFQLPVDWRDKYESRIYKGALPWSCWEWTGAKRDKYGIFTSRSTGFSQLAHRIAYVLAYGDIPDGLVIDHTCGKILCVNPAHLEAVTVAENTRRATAGTTRPKPEKCRRGHLFTLGNTFVDRNGGWHCRQCDILIRERVRRRRGIRPWEDIAAENYNSEITVPKIEGRTLKRYQDKVSQSDAPGGCWLWTGGKSAGGYGGLVVHRNGVKRFLPTHRLAYTLAYGEIPEGLIIRHTCEEKLCVNPAHLEALTHTEKIRYYVRVGRPKAEACSKGHPFTPDNTYIAEKDGYTYQRCKICAREANDAWRRRKGIRVGIGRNRKRVMPEQIRLL